MPDLPLFAAVAAVLVSLAAAPSRAAAAEPAAAVTRFAWISDPHISTLDTATTPGGYTARFTRALDELNRRGDIDFLLLGGDLTEKTGDPAEQDACQKCMERNRIPTHYVAGNHDIGNDSSGAKVEQWVARGVGGGEPPREYYGFTHDGAAFFIINTFACDSKETDVLRRADDQLREMDAFFAANRGAAHKLVCGHAPLFTKVPDEPKQYFNIAPAYRARIMDAMRKNGVREYLAAHRHGDYEVEADGITVRTQAATSFLVGEPAPLGYYVFTLSPDGMKREFVAVQEAEKR
jgi:DNA repair exonuclease SbcCD nuclease subunit